MGEDQKIDVSELENGPVTEANRQCRDIICCLLFLIGIGGMVYLTIFGYMFGNPNHIFRGIDKNGNVCGLSGGVAQNYPYLWFYSPTGASAFQNKLCVDTCPTIAAGATLPAQINCYGVTCTYTFSYSSSGSVTLGSGSPSDSDYVGYDSTTLLSRVCVPSTSVFTNVFASIQSTFSTALSQGDLVSIISDFKTNWMWLLAAFGFSIVVSFIFMYALRCLAGCIVWISLFGILFLLIGVGILFLYNGGTISGGYATTAAGYLGIPTITDKGYNSTIGWVFIGISGVYLIIMLCCCSRIRLAVAVCKCAGQFVAGVCLIVLVPIFQTAIALGLWGGCLVVMVYLVSAANFTVQANTSYFTSLSSYSDTALIRFYCFLFGTLWCNAFVAAMTTFVVASACCMWYYSHGPGQELSLPIFRSYKMIFRYHFGSLAFGSLILAIVQFLQIIVELFKKQAQQSGAANTKCFEYVINCLRCCLACVERIVQFINKTAYIQIALRGKNFCNAAKDGFELVWSNALRYAVVAGVGQVIMFLGKLMIAALTTGGFYCLITFVPSIKATYLAPVYSLIVVFMMSYVVAIFFMSVYSLAMDSLLQCFIVDETNQKGKGGKAALYAPEDLAELIDRD